MLDVDMPRLTSWENLSIPKSNCTRIFRGGHMDVAESWVFPRKNESWNCKYCPIRVQVLNGPFILRVQESNIIGKSSSVSVCPCQRSCVEVQVTSRGNCHTPNSVTQSLYLPEMAVTCRKDGVLIYSRLLCLSTHMTRGIFKRTWLLQELMRYLGTLRTFLSWLHPPPCTILLAYEGELKQQSFSISRLS